MARRIKLLVVACNSATAAALPTLQARLAESDAPAWRRSASSSPPRCRPWPPRAAAASASWPRPPPWPPAPTPTAIAATDPFVEVVSVPCGDLATRIECGTIDAPLVAAVRSHCAPLREAEVDTVILGCTHYPLVEPIIQRMLGPDVAIITSGRAARPPGRARPRHARARPPGHRARAPTASSARAIPRRSSARARASCSCRSARSSRSWSAPAGAPRGEPGMSAPERAGGRGAGRPAPDHDRAGLRPHGGRLGAHRLRRDARDLHGVRAGVRAALDGGPRPRLGHRGVRHAPRVDRRAQGRATSRRAGPTGARWRSSA